MAKTLTYFATYNSKSSFGIEASKNYLTHKRAYYHLIVIESFMNWLGIGFEKDFDLSTSGVKKAINNNIMISLNNNRILLYMENARKEIRYLPLKKESEIEFKTNNPLLAIVKNGSNFKVFHGNRNISCLYPQYFEYDKSIDNISIQIDGKRQNVNFGCIVNVMDHFTVIPLKGYCIIIIGLTKPNVKDESGIHKCKR